jgi:hypothetical protein
MLIPGGSITNIAFSNPTDSVDVCLLCLFCVMSKRPLGQADHLFRGVLLGVCVRACECVNVCMCVCMCV